jgi:DNA topoisomerase-3
VGSEMCIRDSYYSALARQHSDWLVGINLTRAVTLKSKDRSVWSVGRVQTPTLAILVNREKEIENFKPKEYYVIKATFEKDGKTYEGVLIKDRELLENLKDLEENEGDLLE